MKAAAVAGRLYSFLRGGKYVDVVTTIGLAPRRPV